MTVNLSIKGVPVALAERLRARAERNHRSLQGELMAIIERAADESMAPAQPGASQSPLPAPLYRGEATVREEGTSIEQAAAEMRALYPQPVTDLPRSVDIVREMRDSR